MSFLRHDDRIRTLVHSASDLHLPGTACFMAEKLMVSTNSVDDIYELANLYYIQRQYDRALWILNKKQVINKSVKARYLAALCSLALGNANDALEYVGRNNPFSGNSIAQRDKCLNEGEESIKLESALCYVRGKACVMLNDFDHAKECFKEALSVDLKCYDALEALVTYSMMNREEEQEFVMTLPFDDHCGLDANYYRYLYSLRLTKSDPREKIVEPKTNDLSLSLDVQLSEAERHFTEGSYEICLEICKNIQIQDPYFKDSIYILLSCLYELNQKMQLYVYAQEMVNDSKNDAIKWHAVGLYHLFIKRNTDAKRYFTEAININKTSKYSWIGYAHAFSAEKEHDQAIEAYKVCLQTLPEFYIPLMYIATEYMELGNTTLALEYFMKAVEKNNTDPFLYHEVGMFYYKEKNFVEARKYLHIALKLSEERNQKTFVLWERTWLALGQIYRQTPLKDLERSIRCFKKALIYNHRNADAKAAIGMIHQERGNTSQAIFAYSKALEFTDNNEHIHALFNHALEENVSQYTSNYPLLDTSCGFSGSEPDDRHSVEDELGWDGLEDENMSDESSFENLELDSN